MKQKKYNQYENDNFAIIVFLNLNPTCILALVWWASSDSSDCYNYASSSLFILMLLCEVLLSFTSRCIPDKRVIFA